MVFRLDGKWNHIKEVLLTAFPALEKAGGFELVHTDGPYSRRLSPINSQFLTSVSALKQFIDQARIFIRPIQADLSTDVSEDASVQVSAIIF